MPNSPARELHKELPGSQKEELETKKKVLLLAIAILAVTLFLFLGFYCCCHPGSKESIVVDVDNN